MGWLQGRDEAEEGKAHSSAGASGLADSAEGFGAQMRAAAEARRRDLGDAPKQASLPRPALTPSLPHNVS